MAKQQNTLGSPYSTPGGLEQKEQEEEERHGNRDEVDDAVDLSGVVELSFNDK